jgi:hypothetical protein
MVSVANGDEANRDTTENANLLAPNRALYTAA